MNGIQLCKARITDVAAHESECDAVMQSSMMKAMNDPAKHNAVMKAASDIQTAQAKGDVEALIKTAMPLSPRRGPGRSEAQ